ncbi:MAG: hypothetical protein LUD72_12905, partial [Bacteroidales bacterium]|nr:hypothetical protein [Bacteroidales bacterium]
MRKVTWEEFLKRAIIKHNDKFDYSYAVYADMRTKIKIVCKTCGYTFYQTPIAHLSTTKKNDCRQCSYVERANKKRKPFSRLLKEMTEKHNGRYKYDGAEEYYVNNKSKIPIECPTHGIFWQVVSKHINGHGCKKCADIERGIQERMPFEKFKELANKTHNSFYNYDKLEKGYEGVDKEGIITCPIHGDFSQLLIVHYKGQGCPECGHIKTVQKKQIPFSEFVKGAKEAHGVGRYEYFEDKYVNLSVKTLIRCNKCGKEFWQLPSSHIYNKCGCPYCNESLLEKDVVTFLEEMEIKYEREKQFEWLRYKRRMRLDFFLPQYNMVIECQGQQHFGPVDFAGRGGMWAEKEFIKIQDKDRVKKEKCEEHGLTMLYYNH